MNTLFPASSIARLPLFRFASMFGFLDVSCVCFFVSPCRRSDARLAPYGGAGRPLVLYATLRFNGGRFSCPVFPRRRPTFPFPPCCLACRHPAGDGRARARCAAATPRLLWAPVPLGCLPTTRPPPTVSPTPCRRRVGPWTLSPPWSSVGPNCQSTTCHALRSDFPNSPRAARGSSRSCA